MVSPSASQISGLNILLKLGAYWMGICGVATLTIDYYDLGFTTGLMAHQILTGQADISQMPIQYAPNFSKMFNPEICDALGLTMPDDYLPITG